MKFERLYSKAGTPVRDQVKWKRVEARIEDGATGEVVFSQPNVEVPEAWSQTATNILAQKYFRKAGVPSETLHVRIPGDEEIVPKWLWKSDATVNATRGSETSAHQVFHRLAGCWTYWGWKVGLFHAAAQNGARGGQVVEYAQIFYDELYMMLALQVAAPNSPQFFNTGLWWAYSIEGPDSGMWVCDFFGCTHEWKEDEETCVRFCRKCLYPLKHSDSSIAGTGVPYRITNAYERPQAPACFLTSITDDLVNEGGIMDAWVREARIFKHGSGSGTNVSKLRAKGEPLSGGGVASGVMSWLRIADRAAGAIASGGTTRRAATMRILDVDHPEVEDFINWKVREEAKAAAMYVGSRMMINVGSKANIDEAYYKILGVPQAITDRTDAGFKPEIFGIGWEEEAIETVSGQNSNNSIRVSDAFMWAVENDGLWNLTARTTGKPVKTVRARDLWDQACRAAWACADPGVIFSDNMNKMNTCIADGEITTVNPCSEYNFLNDTACNLASLRLTAFLRNRALVNEQEINLNAFDHACRLWTCVLDVSVSMASYPAKEFALGAYNYRTLGLGYADLGGLLAQLDLRYDSEEGRSLAAALTALMTGVAYQTSAKLAEELGPYPRWEANKESHYEVMEKHNLAVGQIKSGKLVAPIVVAASDSWNVICRAKSFRNAQTTLLAPTGTISLVMDCQTSGIEPFFARKSVKSLAGGGSISTEHTAVRDEDTAMHLPPMAHVRMMAAVQPFLSGAISKTINMPSDARVFEVNEIYLAAHRLGLKAVAVYRDGSKLTQPMRVKTEALGPSGGNRSGVKILENVLPHAESPAPSSLAGGQERGTINTGTSQLSDEPLLEQLREMKEGLVTAITAEIKDTQIRRPKADRGTNEHLPWRREKGYTQKAKIDGQSIFWRVSEYPDGRPGEIFIELAHEGSTLRATANCVAIAISVALKHGTPLDALVDKFLGTKFDPAGVVEGHDRIKIATSYMDLIARDLAITYLGREDLANIVQLVTVDTLERSVVALDKRALALASGRMTGEMCRLCGGLLIQTGTCKTCQTCGFNEGCGG